MRPGTEQRVLDAAEELFFSRGIAATPIDVVLERAHVSSATLYRGWSSKEALVAAALDRRHDDWVATWDRAVDRARDDRGRLLAVFDALDDYRATPAGSRWCAFLGTAAEYVDAPADVRAVLDRETDTLRRRLAEAARPLVGVSRAPMRCMSVDLPDPDGPMIVTNSPLLTRSDTPRTAFTVRRPCS